MTRKIKTTNTDPIDIRIQLDKLYSQADLMCWKLYYGVKGMAADSVEVGENCNAILPSPIPPTLPP